MVDQSIWLIIDEHKKQKTIDLSWPSDVQSIDFRMAL